MGGGGGVGGGGWGWHANSLHSFQVVKEDLKLSV